MFTHLQPRKNDKFIIVYTTCDGYRDMLGAINAAEMFGIIEQLNSNGLRVHHIIEK